MCWKKTDETYVAFSHLSLNPVQKGQKICSAEFLMTYFAVVSYAP